MPHGSGAGPPYGRKLTVISVLDGDNMKTAFDAYHTIDP